MKQDIAKIIDFLYSHPSIPDDLLHQIQDWMNRHEDNPEVTATLMNIWDEEFGKDAGCVTPLALERLLTEVESQTTAAPLRKNPFKNAWKYVAAVVAFVTVCTAAYFFGSANSTGETMLITAKGSAGSFTLPDGSTVRLNSDSRLCYNSKDFLKASKRKVKIDGEAYFDVTKDSRHPFVVEMADMDVEVLGTCFEVRDYSFSNLKEVVLLSGKVQVQTAGASTPTVLSPDQRFIYNRPSKDSKIENADAHTYCRWIYPKLKIENEPLRDLLITIGRKYSVDLTIAPDVDLNQRLSITLVNEDLEDLMSVISYLTDIDYNISDNTLSVTTLK